MAERSHSNVVMKTSQDQKTCCQGMPLDGTSRKPVRQVNHELNRNDKGQHAKTSVQSVGELNSNPNMNKPNLYIRIPEVHVSGSVLTQKKTKRKGLEKAWDIRNTA